MNQNIIILSLGNDPLMRGGFQSFVKDTDVYYRIKGVLIIIYPLIS